MNIKTRRSNSLGVFSFGRGPKIEWILRALKGVKFSLPGKDR